MSDSALIYSPESNKTNNNSKDNHNATSGKSILCKKRNCKYFKYETNEKQRLRIKTNLLNQLGIVLEEYYKRVQGEAVIIAMSTDFESNFRIVGTFRLKLVAKEFLVDIHKNIKRAMETNEYTDDSFVNNPTVNLFPLPPLRVDDTPIALNKMTQAHLRAFIPMMLKYSLGRGKPGWGKKIFQPVWWPEDVPWANIRTDTRSPEEKAKSSWSHTLRRIVKCCYEYHGRQDLIGDIKLVEPRHIKNNTNLKLTTVNKNEGNKTKNSALMTPDGPVTFYYTVVSVEDDSSVLPDQHDSEEASR